MIKLLKYYIKKKWPFFLFVLLSGFVINFIILLTNGDYFYDGPYGDMHVYNPPLVFLTCYAPIISTLFPIINFSFKMKKINVDQMYSLPIKRKKLFLATLLFTLIEVFLPITILFAQSYIDVLLSNHHFVLKYFFVYYLFLLLASLSLCCIVSFIYCRNNTVSDGVVNIAMIAIFPLMAVYAMDLLIHFNNDFIDRFFNGVYYSIYSPFTNINDLFFPLIKGGVLGGIHSKNNDVIIIMFIVFVLVAIASFFGLLYFANKDKAENTMQKSTSAFSYKVMVPIFMISSFVLLYTSLITAIGLVSIGGIGLYCFYNRTIKLHWKQWVLLGVYLIVGFILAYIAYEIGSNTLYCY